MWRVTPDEYPLNAAAPIILGHLADDLHLYESDGPGHWNDLDMVAPDMPSSGWSRGDLQSQLSVWAEEASPLLISADLSKLTSAELGDLKNPIMIAIDQSGSQAPVTVMSGTMEAIVKSTGGGMAVLLANWGRKMATGKFSCLNSMFQPSLPLSIISGSAVLVLLASSFTLWGQGIRHC